MNKNKKFFKVYGTTGGIEYLYGTTGGVEYLLGTILSLGNAEIFAVAMRASYSNVWIEL